MHRFFVYLFAIILTFGCSSISQKNNVLEKPDSGEWIYEPQKACNANEICASGEGKNQEQADLNAKKSLASIFETKINAKFEYTKQSIDDAEVSEMKESIVDEVNAQVDQVLKAVEIKKRFEKNDLIFSLAVLDKLKSSKVLRQELTRIDDELTHYMRLKNRVYIKKLVKLYNKREILNEKLTLTTESGIARKVRFSKIKALKYDEKTQKKIKLIFEDAVPNTLQIKTQSSLTDVGFKVTNKDDNDLTITAKYEVKEEYLNVKGFQKYTFSYFLESRQSSGKKIGGAEFIYTSNGRDKKNAFLKIRKKMLEDIDNSLDKLNLDME